MKTAKFMVAIAAVALMVAGTAASAPGDDAEFVQASVSKLLAPGARRSVTVMMKNTGTTTWTKAAGHRLGAQNPADNFIWGPNRADLAADVPPGATATFTFDVTAPKEGGTYNFQWRMVHEGVSWFGVFTPNVAIDVK
jgi:hypothetical protein